METLLVHEGLVRGLARAVLRGDDRVDDVVQDTWVASLRGGPDDPAALRGWLARVARRFALLTRRRDAGRRRTEEAATRARGAPTAQEIAEREEARRRVLDALLELDAPHREALLLRFYEGLPPREIARRLEVPVETARTRVKRGLERLRARLLVDRRRKGNAGLVALALPGRRSTASAAVGAGGVLVVKKLAVAALVVLLLGAAAWIVLPRPSVGGKGSVSPEFGSASARPTDAQAGLPPAARRAETGAAPAAKGPRLTGLVVDETGVPVSGASVLAMPDTLAKAWTAVDAAKEGGPGAAATTGPDGRFDLPARGAVSYDLHASAPDRATALFQGARVGRDVRVRLPSPDLLLGRVTDADVVPVAGARLRLFGLVGALRYERETTTDPKGAYRLPLPAVVGDPGLFVFQVEVRAEGYAVLSIGGPFLPRAGRERRRDLVLVHGATLSGRVLDAETGDALADARVLLWSNAGTSPVSRRGFGAFSLGFVASPYPALVLGETRSGADGSFVFAHVPARGFDDPSYGGMLGSVAATKEGWAPATRTVGSPEDGAQVDVALRLSPSAVVVGRVVTPDGHAAHPASVGASPHTGTLWSLPAVFGDVPLSSAATDADGRYRIPAAPASRAGTTVKLRANLGGFDMGLGPAVDVSVPVRAGETTTAPDLVIAGIGKAVGDLEIALRVVDPAGRPVEGARVSLSDGDLGRTDADGVRRIEWSSSWPRKTPASLVVRATGFAPAATLNSPTTPGAPPEEVRLAPARRLTGRVLSAGGAPVAGAEVIVADPAADEAVAFPDVIQLANFSTSLEAASRARLPPVFGSTTTDADGAFAVDDLPPGPWAVCARLRRGPRWAFPVLAPLRVVRRDAPEGGGELVLTLPEDDAGPFGRVVATVTDAVTGRPVLRFQAALARAPANAPGVLTGPGRAEWDIVPAGPWTLEVAAPGYLTGRLDDVEVKEGAAPAAPSIALSRGASVVGRLLDERGKPPAEFEVALVPSQGREPTVRPIQASVAPDGTFRASGLAPGTYRLHAGTAQALTFPRGTQGLVVPKDGGLVAIEDPAGERALGDVRVAPAGQIEVIVVDVRLPSAPMAGYTEATEAQVRFGETCHVVVTDERGRVVADQRGLWSTGHKGALDPLVVLPGTYVVRFECGADPVRERKVTVPEGSPVRALFDLR